MNYAMRVAAILLTAVAVFFHGEWSELAAQVKGPAVREVNGTIIREVNPSDTDKRIDTFTGPGNEHVAYLKKDANPRGQLAVFLPGTGGNGHGAVKFCMQAAAEGYHVVALTYPSAVSVSKYRASEDATAFRKARENIIHGKQPFMDLKITEPDSIENRLVKVVEHLAAVAPKQRWGQYLTKKNTLAWGKIVLTGQSQGAGHSAFLATQHKVARVVMLAGPKDYNIRLNKSGEWLTDAKETPLNRFFCFNHTEDGKNGCTYPQQLENYRAMNLMPKYKVVDVDHSKPPYQHSRLLTSTRTVEMPHTAVLGDPTYKAVWSYLLTEPVE